MEIERIVTFFLENNEKWSVLQKTFSDVIDTGLLIVWRFLKLNCILKVQILIAFENSSK